MGVNKDVWKQCSRNHAIVRPVILCREHGRLSPLSIEVYGWRAFTLLRGYGNVANSNLAFAMTISLVKNLIFRKIAPPLGKGGAI